MLPQTHNTLAHAIMIYASTPIAAMIHALSANADAPSAFGHLKNVPVSQRLSNLCRVVSLQPRRCLWKHLLISLKTHISLINHIIS